MRDRCRQAKNSNNIYDSEDDSYFNLPYFSQNFIVQEEKFLYPENVNLNQDSEITSVKSETNQCTNAYTKIQKPTNESNYFDDFDDEINIFEDSFISNKSFHNNNYFNNIFKYSPNFKKKLSDLDNFINDTFYLSCNSPEQFGNQNDEEKSVSSSSIPLKDEKIEIKNIHKEIDIEYKEEEINKNFIRDREQKIINGSIKKNNLFKINVKGDEEDIMEIPFPNQTLGRPGAGKYYTGKKRHDRCEVGNMTNHLIILCGKNITKLIEVKTKIKVDGINITKLIKSKICLLRKDLTHVGTHDKMRLMFDQTLEKLYFYYDSLPTRVKNENLLREQYDENKRREKKKENYKNNKMKIGALINAEKGKEKKPITALFNLKFIDFLKVFIGYDEEDKNKDNENNKKIIKIDEEKYGLKEIELEGFQTYEEYIQTIIDQKEIANKNKYRKHIIKIINKEIKTKYSDLFKQLII